MLIKGAPDYLLKGAKKVMTHGGNVVDFTESSKKAFEN